MVYQSRLHFTENLHYKFITKLPEGVLEIETNSVQVYIIVIH